MDTWLVRLWQDKVINHIASGEDSSTKSLKKRSKIEKMHKLDQAIEHKIKELEVYVEWC